MRARGSGLLRRRSLLWMLAGCAMALNAALAFAGGEQDLRSGQELAKKGDYPAALAKWRKASDAGNAEAAFLIGFLHESGKGVDQDYGEAAAWYRKSANGGFPDAMYRLGMLRDLGKGVNQSHGKALRWTRKAAEAGHGLAMVQVGYAYDRGRGVKKDHAKAMEWYRKAAKLDIALAHRNIGNLYDRGLGVEQDYGEALRWYRSAADLGNVAAMTYVADFYNEGLGVKQDLAEASRWYLKAAQGGNEVAMHRISHMYADGRGIRQDFRKALPWFQAYAKLHPEDHYMAMRVWQCLSRSGKSAEARAFLTQHRSEQKPKGWPAAILAYLSEPGSASSLLEKAKSEDAKTQSEQLCEAHYWIGSTKLIANDKRAARDHFRKCVATGVADFVEYKGAKAELKRLKAAPR